MTEGSCRFTATIIKTSVLHDACDKRAHYINICRYTSNTDCNEYIVTWQTL